MVNIASIQVRKTGMEKTKKKRRKKSHPAAIAITALFIVVVAGYVSLLIYSKAKKIAYSERPLVLLLEDDAWNELNTQYTRKKTEKLLDEKGWRYDVKTAPIGMYAEAEKIAQLISESCAEYNPTVLILAPDFTAILGASGRDNTIPDLTAGRFRPLFVGIGQNRRMNMFDMVFSGKELDGWDKVASHFAASGEKIAFVYNSDNDYANGVYNIFIENGVENIRPIVEAGKDFAKKLGGRLADEGTDIAVIPYLSEFALCINELSEKNFRLVTDEIHSLLLSGKTNTYGILLTDMPSLIDSITNDVILPYKPGRNIVLPLPKVFEDFNAK